MFLFELYSGKSAEKWPSAMVSSHPTGSQKEKKARVDEKLQSLLRPRDPAWHGSGKNSGSVPDAGLSGTGTPALWAYVAFAVTGRGREIHLGRSLWAFSGITVTQQSGNSAWHGGGGQVPHLKDAPHPHSTHQSLLMPPHTDCGQNGLLSRLYRKLLKAAQASAALLCSRHATLGQQ